MPNFDRLIDDLAGDLAPVVPISAARGRVLLAGVALAICAAVLALLGVRPDVAAGRPAPLLLLVAGLFAIAGAAAASAAIRAAQPAVGAARDGARWALASLAILPLVALATMAASPAPGAGLWDGVGVGVGCVLTGLIGSLAALAALTWWLRRGAPVSVEKTGWLAGAAAGAIGALAVTLECPEDVVTHMGTWHVTIVPAAAAIGRTVIPRLARW